MQESERTMSQSVQSLLSLSREVPHHFDAINTLLLGLQGLLSGGKKSVEQRKRLLDEAESSLRSEG